MARLADVTFEARIVLKILAGFFITVTLIFLTFKGGEFVIKTFFTPEPEPGMAFGKLPAIQFPKNTPPKVQYRLNTLDGKLPAWVSGGKIVDRLKVYKVKKNPPSIASLQRARRIVKEGGYMLNETKLSDAVYQWSDRQGRRIEYNILTNSFKIGSQYSETSSLAGLGTRFSTKEEAFKNSAEFLKELMEDTSDLDSSKTELVFLKISDGRIVIAESLTDAQFLRVDLFQKNLKGNPKDNSVGYPLYYNLPKQSTMYFVYKSEGSFPVISEANYLHYRTDENSDYYIKSAARAFEDLKNGKAFVWTDSPKTGTIDITDVSLGYYAGEENQSYFVPVVVFKGNGFIAYVNAIPDALVEQ